MPLVLPFIYMLNSCHSVFIVLPFILYGYYPVLLAISYSLKFDSHGFPLLVHKFVLNGCHPVLHVQNQSWLGRGNSDQKFSLSAALTVSVCNVLSYGITGQAGLRTNKYIICGPPELNALREV